MGKCNNIYLYYYVSKQTNFRKKVHKYAHAIH